MSEARRGDWCQVYSGGVFWPLDPRADEVRIEDIAHALSMICRFGGHSKSFYSVAQHSVLVSLICGKDDARWGLLHDAAEAYVGDMVRPIKHMPELAGYRRAESAILSAIANKFDLPIFPPQSVVRADNVLLATEARDIMGGQVCPWHLTQEPLAMKICPVGPEEAECLFLLRFDELGGKR